MNIKNMLISVAIVGVLSLCAFNSVTAAPVSKFTPDNQGNCAANVNGRQQTCITAAVSLIDPILPWNESQTTGWLTHRTFRCSLCL